MNIPFKSALKFEKYSVVLCSAKRKSMKSLSLSAVSVGYKWFMFQGPSLYRSLGCDVSMEGNCPTCIPTSSLCSNVTSDSDDRDRYIPWNISHLEPTPLIVQEDVIKFNSHEIFRSCIYKIKFSEVVRAQIAISTTEEYQVYMDGTARKRKGIYEFYIYIKYVTLLIISYGLISITL